MMMMMIVIALDNDMVLDLSCVWDRQKEYLNVKLYSKNFVFFEFWYIFIQPSWVKLAEAE